MDALTSAARTATINFDDLDDAIITDSTPSFVGGQRSYGSADQLQPSEARSLVNMDIRDGFACTRRGHQLLGSKFTGRIQGLAWYSSPTHNYIVAATGGGLQKWDETAWSTCSSYAAADSSRQICFAQLIDILYIADGSTDLYSWDGSTLTDLGSNTMGDGTKPPVGSIIINATQRIFMAGLAGVPDGLACSKPLDGSTWDSTHWQIRVGSGDGDPITGLAAWDNNQIVVFKRSSIWIVSADPAVTSGTTVGTGLDGATITKVSDTIGCVSHRSIAIVGSDVWFLSDFGVLSVGRVLAQTQREVKAPISLPIQDLIDRINWSAASAASAVFWNNRYMLSVPLDSDQSPTTILVFNTQRQSWSGAWTGVSAICYALSKASGNVRLNLGRLDGGVWRWLDYVQLADEVESTFQDIGSNYASSVTTRAMIFGDAVFPKSPFNVSPEYIQSTTTATLSIILDEGSPAIINASIQTGGPPLLLPFTLPALLPGDGVQRSPFSLMQLPQCRSMQTMLSANAGKLSVRAVVASAMLDTMVIE